MLKAVAALFVVLCAAATACGQGMVAAVSRQTQTDEYTRYELLSPETSSFAIRYEVTATTAGAYFFNPTRRGSVASDESSGIPLIEGEAPSVDYIKAYLARPIPPEGQARLLILKMYEDAKSYYGLDRNRTALRSDAVYRTIVLALSRQW